MFRNFRVFGGGACLNFSPLAEAPPEVRLLLIGPRSPRQLEEEPAPYAVSGATIALRDVYRAGRSGAIPEGTPTSLGFGHGASARSNTPFYKCTSCHDHGQSSLTLALIHHL